MWKEYYTDGVTKRTDPLYICSCSCGKCYWKVMWCMCISRHLWEKEKMDGKKECRSES